MRKSMPVHNGTPKNKLIMKKLQLSISPCPNDTFMFEAMLHDRIDTEGLEFEVSFYDIEELNKRLLQGSASGPDISKASYAIVPQIMAEYCVLRSGSALGRGNGPLLVGSGSETDLNDNTLRIAIPGLHTTANMIMERLYPELRNKTPLLFSEIAEAVRAGEYDAGILIHEGRFVYGRYGLKLLKDLGLEWEIRTGLALPLGAIVASRRLPHEIVAKTERVLRRSVEYGLEHPEKSCEFVRSHAREMEEDVIRRHIELFVNSFSADIGTEGEKAITMLLGVGGNEIFRE